MNKVTAIEHQSLADLVLQETGSIEGLVAFAQENGVAVTYVPEPGEKLNVPEELNGNKQIFDYYFAKRIKPASLYGMNNQGNQQLFENGLFENGLFE